jgi:hypothetical protein
MLDVRGSRELQATILALRQAERGIRLDINKAARSKIRPVWQGELSARARTSLERRVILPGARATASDRGVTVFAATKNRPLSGGLIPSRYWAAVEFGANTRRMTVRQRSRSGASYRRPLTVNRAFKPQQAHGMIAMAAASDTGTRLVALWVRTVVDEFAAIDAVEVTG